MEEHHIWCNYFTKPAENCKFCKRLHKEYPMEDMTGEELQKKYFPDAIMRKKENI